MRQVHKGFTKLRALRPNICQLVQKRNFFGGFGFYRRAIWLWGALDDSSATVEIQNMSKKKIERKKVFCHGENRFWKFDKKSFCSKIEKNQKSIFFRKSQQKSKKSTLIFVDFFEKKMIFSKFFDFRTKTFFYQIFKIDFLHDKKLFFVQKCFFDIFCISTVAESHLGHPGVKSHACKTQTKKKFLFCTNWHISTPNLVNPLYSAGDNWQWYLGRRTGCGERVRMYRHVGRLSGSVVKSTMCLGKVSAGVEARTPGLYSVSLNSPKNAVGWNHAEQEKCHTEPWTYVTSAWAI